MGKPYSYLLQYRDLRRKVEKLKDRLPLTVQKDTLDYVLSLFKMQDEDPTSLRELVAKKPGRPKGS